MAALSFDTLKKQVKSGEVDTVLACIIDMQGRLMGKRFHAAHFIDSAWEESHCCNYLLATDLEMYTVEGYAATSWEGGYGDYIMKPDLETLRPAPWLEGTVLVLCDVLDHHSHEPVAHSPRAMLKAQVARLAEMGITPMMATELEFNLFRKSYDEIRASGYTDLATISPYNEDYSIQLTLRDEVVLRPVRNALYAAGIPVENTKGEAEVGQEELNIKYAPAVDCADYHTIAKHCVKDIALEKGHSASFLPKWHRDRVGNSTHIHQSMWKDGKNVFFDPDDKLGMSDLMKSYCAGIIKYAPDYTYFLAPNINSYKRFQKGTFAPTKAVWSVDNRTAGFRLCGEGSKAVRMECRIGGSDMNPYLGMAVQIAAGLKGIEEGLQLAPPTAGDVYDSAAVVEIPATLRAARETLTASAMLREAFGDAVIDHYTHAADWEQEAFDAVVTDWELQRGFERA
ncbi:glutamine synthetase family protein [Pseudooceanicola sp. HF7]|uniref:glutamine synthetase family protein n=1 Tax=Pseudooceanicola sp. HF7 TaxID=2721560 RepID=UPI001431CEF2|nr:glutamine synthetase family protein [Pseudooceanicola sp. HF7]NIZ08526.1 glutamine synthetase [Pseudooceanicola sp. HF7]